MEIAQSTANTAVTKAEAAQETASAAQNTAATAQETANAAKQDAQTAQDEIDAIGESLETLSTTMEAEYARKTDLTEAEAALQTQISQNAAQISSTATLVEEIDETANSAAAQAAQTAADNAQAAADQAQAAVDALETRVTSAETNITQNAEQIALAATKEEVTETLGGYYTKEETDSAITVSSESIHATVSEEITEEVNGVQANVEEVSSSVEQLAGSISTLITDENGQSLMEQTAEGWTFNMGDLQESIEEAAEGINEVKGNMAEVSNLAQKTSDLANDIAAKTAYVNMSQDDTGAPVLELGKQDNPFKVRITNTSIDFMEGTEKIAYITNRSLYIQSSVVTDEMKIGATSGFIWKKRGNGNMGLRWVAG